FDPPTNRPVRIVVDDTVPLDLFYTPTAPAIIANPTNQVAVVGQTVTFAVSATAQASLRYQWQFNGANIPGATNASLVLSNVASSQAGQYRVVVTTAYGASTTSGTASLTVQASPLLL